jgi:hypothetical protein
MSDGSVNGSAARSVPPLPWGDDEHLRDEGVVFGLMDDHDGIEAVRTCIRTHFDAHRHAVARKREALQQRLDELVARRVDAKTDLDRMDASTAEAATPAETPSVGRAAVGLLLAVGFCALNYPLLVTLWAPALDLSVGVAAGTLLTGLFGGALLQGGRPPTSWMAVLRAGVVPLATALLVVAWRLPALDPVPAAATFLYLFAFFAIGGHGTMRLLARFDAALSAWRLRRRSTQHRTQHLPEIDREAHDVQQALLDLPSEGELDAEEARTLALFESEVALARASRRHLDPATADAVLYPPDY